MEAHHPIGTGVAVKRGDQGPAEAPPVAADLGFEQYRYPASDQIKQLGEDREGLAAEFEVGEVGEGRLGNDVRAAAQPSRVGIVEDEDLVIGGEAKVAFDPRAKLKRGGERRQTILDDRRRAMKPAMREPARAGIERIDRL